MAGMVFEFDAHCCAKGVVGWVLVRAVKDVLIYA